MILEYEYLIGFDCNYVNSFDYICHINVTKDKIEIVDFGNIVLQKRFIKSIELHEYELKIEYLGIQEGVFPSILSGKEIGNKIKEYYVYNKRKSIIEKL